MNIQPIMNINDIKTWIDANSELSITLFKNSYIEHDIMNLKKINEEKQIPLTNFIKNIKELIRIGPGKESQHTTYTCNTNSGIVKNALIYDYINWQINEMKYHFITFNARENTATILYKNNKYIMGYTIKQEELTRRVTLKYCIPTKNHEYILTFHCNK